MASLGRLGFGGRPRMVRAAERAESAFAGAPAGKALTRAARDYGVAVRLAAELDPALAARLVRAYDARIPREAYTAAFGPQDEPWLAELAARGDNDGLEVAFSLADRLGLANVRMSARDRTADLVGRAGDADRTVAVLLRFKGAGLLDADTVARAVRAHLEQAPLSRDAHVWSALFDELPEPLLPELGEVHCFLGRGRDAVRLADSPALERRAIDCCARSADLDDVAAGLDLARRLTDRDAVRRLESRRGDLLFDRGDHSAALACFEAAGRADRAGACHEQLGDFFAALACCPPDRPERVAALLARCRPEVDALVEQGEFTTAARRAGELSGHAERAGIDPAETRAQQAAVTAAGRRHHRARLAARDDADGRTSALVSWSGFEEAAGDVARAAELAVESGDLYRAHRLYRGMGRFGEADAVLRADDSDEGRLARAAVRETGGDILGAARLYAESGERDRAVGLFMQAGEYGMAADILSGTGPADDPRLRECLLRAGRLDELVRLLGRDVHSSGAAPDLADELHALRRHPGLTPARAAEVDRLLDVLEGSGRQRFQERVQAWIGQARREVDARFAGVWGLDLGTTTCAVAIYDADDRIAVLCPWKGRTHFPATLSLDRQGNEVVGLSDEETLASWVVGHIGAAKRAMGTRRVYRVRERTYRPEEVAARMIRHARGLVEAMLAERVRERVAALARAELGTVREEWLAWAERNHDLRLERPKAVLTIPAYFLNNQKHATRDACRIAGVEPVRLIHEPTAACITAARERRLEGRVCVVDLGAGTLDVSEVEVDDSVHEVKRVHGDTRYGGKDFDAAIAEVLTRRLAGGGIDVSRSGVARRRVAFAAEFLKVALSVQERAEYALPALVDGRDAELVLTRGELADILAESLGTLHRACTAFRDAWDRPPDHLVLVGGPMLAPMVREVAEDVLGRRRTVISDPRTAVACGAALQAAVLDGRLQDLLLLDATPLPLGIRVLDQEQGKDALFTLIEAHTTIPTVGRNTFTTVEDGQSRVRVEILNGPPGPDSRVGEVLLSGIPPAPAGVPAIEVQFTIDASCVLDVTVTDEASGQTKSLQITDSTLLTPDEVRDMADRRLVHEELSSLREELRTAADSTEADDADAAWREFRQRLSAHRPAAEVSAEDRRLLTEIFAEAGDREVELQLTREPLRDLAGQARGFLARADDDGAGAPDEQLAQARHLAREMGALSARLRAVLERLAAWNALLVRLAAADGNPLDRFRAAHDAGDHARALTALRESATSPTDPADIRRRLRSLAEVGDARGYREVLTSHAERLGAAVLDPAHPEAFFARVCPALVTVTGRETGAGFLVSDRLVVTNRRLVADRGPAGIGVDVAGVGTLVPTRVFAPAVRGTDLALLRLAEPVRLPGFTPIRLGHVKLLGIGDRVWSAAPDGTPHGVVDGFESFPEQGLRLIRAGLRLPPGHTGGPLLNDLGEAVGVLAIKPTDGPLSDNVFALTTDALTPLLTDATETPVDL